MLSCTLGKCHRRNEIELASAVGLYNICSVVSGSTSATKLLFSSNMVDWIN
jgi:hypothetical protein